MSVVSRSSGLAGIQSERRLSVRARSHEPKAAIETPYLGKEVPDGLSAPIPVTPRWHRVGRIFFQERHESVEVGCFPGFDIALEQRALLEIPWEGCSRPVLGITRRQ